MSQSYSLFFPSQDSVDLSSHMETARRRNYMRKTKAARTLQTAYRRYRQNNDRRQLGSIVRSYKRANPYQITPSSGRTCTFWRKTEINLTLNQLSGFQGAGASLNWGFSLAYVYGYLNGTYSFSPGVPSSAEFQALFDYYQIRSVKMQLFFTKNVTDVANSAGLGLPIFLLANDFDDINTNETFSSMMQRVGCRHVQIDATNGNGIKHYIKPRPSNTIMVTDPVTGIQSTASVGIPFGSTWINTTQTNVVHNGVKILYDAQGLTTNQTIGNVTLVFDIEYCFKGYR